MAAPVQCDICRELPGRYWVTDSDTGQVTTMCPGCFAMIGMTAFLSGDADLVDGVLKERGFVPSAAEKKRRKDDAEPEYDANRVIAAVVESAPTPPEPLSKEELAVVSEYLEQSTGVPLSAVALDLGDDPDGDIEGYDGAITPLVESGDQPPY